MTPAAGRLSVPGSPHRGGSVFAVTRQLALTCFHCVRDARTKRGVISRVRCMWRDEISDAIVQDWAEADDVALLRLGRALPDSLDPIPLSSDVASNEPFVALGASEALSELPLAAVNGWVIDPNAQMPDGKHGIQLLCLPAVAGMPLYGFSGAPVLTGNQEKAVGVIRWNPPQAEHPERAEGAMAYAVPARRVIELWPELAPVVNMQKLLQRLADRGRLRDAHSVHADVRTILLAGGLHLDEDDLRVIPGPGGGRSRLIAVDRGHAIIAVERDLLHDTVVAVAKKELADAVSLWTKYAEQRYAAVLTDGVTWRLYHEVKGQLNLLDEMKSDSRAPEKLLGWLEAIVATGREIAPDRDVIESKLGSSSPWYKLAAAELTAIYQEHREVPTVEIKRRMWAKLLTTASGTSFADKDPLFIDHTLLVAIAKVIGHAILKFSVEGREITAAALMSGIKFSEVGITGAIEADFFDWITEVPGGDKYITNLARRLARFEWSDVSHDVLKQIYESVIPQATRHQLGEYYTPDWLAQAIISEAVREPLRQRVLDASCGSGTFLFHAIKAYLSAAEAVGMPPAEAVNGVVTNVIGIDVHPVAVTLARVTYLLALSSYLQERSSGFTVPVFLGDSMRWGQETNLLTYDYSGLSVSTRLDPESFVTGTAAPSEPEFGSQLNFPDRVVAETDRFDLLVTRLADLATSRDPGSPVPRLAQIFEQFGISDGEKPLLQQTFENMCKLHDAGKNHIWGYYVRNLARPAWLARPHNQVDVLLGNPPWLVYRYMTRRQQHSFKQMSDQRGLWAGGPAATNHDLAALFVTRCIELYLRPGGHFGYVMPWAVLPRPGQGSSRPHSGFRRGSYPTKDGTVRVAFTQTWDLHRIKPSFFPLKPGVVFGRRQRARDDAVPLPEQALVWEGRFETKQATWAQAPPRISILTAERPIATTRQSPYASRFTQGASVVPRMLFLVNLGEPGPLGTVAGRRPVQSRRSANEKMPWKQLADVTGSVEKEFIRPVYLGECVLPFRCLPPVQAIIPWDGHRLLGESDMELARNPGLADWLHKCETTWERYRSSDRLTLLGQLDYRRKLSQQFSLTAHRVVYSKSGMYLAATRVSDPTAVIDHQLYWGALADLDEARYLAAILNSSLLTMAVRPMQARGEHNPRHFDKYIFQLPIPQYDSDDAAHVRLVALAERAEQVAAAVTLPNVRFERQRKHIRDALDEDGVAADIDVIVKSLLDAVA